MIIYNLRTPVETDKNNCVGVTGENNAFSAKFLIKGLDEKGLTFSIHLRFSDGSVNTVVPDSVTSDKNGTEIVWNVKQGDIFVHGFFELQIEARNKSGYIFQTEILRLYADESIPIEDGEYENPNSETIKLREEAYELLCELKLQQNKLDENMKLLLESDITKKENASLKVSDKRYVADGSYPSVKYLENYYYDQALTDLLLEEKQNAVYIPTLISEMSELLKYNDVNSVYCGVMQGFSTKLGQKQDNMYLGFRMFFLQSSPVEAKSYNRIVQLSDGSVWQINGSGLFPTLQLSYSKNQIKELLNEKSDKENTYSKSETEAALALKYDSANIETGSSVLTPYSGSVDAVQSASCDYRRVDNMCFLKIMVIMKEFTLKANSSIHLIDLPFAQKAKNQTICFGGSNLGKQFKALIPKTSSWFSITQLTGASVQFQENEELHFFVAYTI